LETEKSFHIKHCLLGMVYEMLRAMLHGLFERLIHHK